MLLDKIREAGRDCTGCSLCMNICPVSAITMKPEEKGFILPSIDISKCTNCKKCEKSCPQLNYKSVNDPEPACYAIKMSDDVLMKSSSGGAFTALANYVFDKGGYVCGAAYDEGFMGVSHIMISDRKDMYKLRGSKYVQSKIGDIYKQVAEKLKEGHYVLFSGTPCQTAALHAFLPKGDDKLITVDILCAGVPSEKIFKKYVEEISNGRKIKYMHFRPKMYGWHYSGIYTKFTDGTSHMIHSLKDPYMRGFVNFLFIRYSCFKCQFAPAPKPADFTIGDFWSIDKFDESIETTKGISCMLLNNQKAANIFEEIKDGIPFVKRMPFSFLRRFNRMNEVKKPVLAKHRFYSLIREGYTFEKAVDYSLGWKFDIAVSGCWTVNNYGGNLTYYALYKTLKDMGYSVIMVERRADIPGYDVPKPRQFDINPYPFYDVCRIHKNIEDQRELNVRVKTFIIGSDQVWNYALMKEDFVKSWSFDYVGNYRRKIAYASSFGSTKFNGTNEQKKTFANILKKFNAVAVRENSGIKICEEMGVNAVQVMDPVFLCNRKYFNELAQKSKFEPKGNYIFSYIIHPNSYKFGIDKICSEKNYGHVCTLGCDVDREKLKENNFPYKYEERTTVESWVKQLFNSSLVIADSFHACCFSLLYHVPFVFVRGQLNYESGMDRLSTLMKITNLEDRVVTTVEEAYEKKIYDQPIDWDDVDARLRPEIERSRQWLIDALNTEILQL